MPRVVTLWWLMRKFEPDVLMNKMRDFTNSADIGLIMGKTVESRPAVLSLLFKKSSELVAVCEAAGLRTSAKAVARIQELIHFQQSGAVFDCSALQRASQIMATTIEDELSTHEFFMMDSSEAKAWGRKNLYGDVVSDAFPSTDCELEEETKCYAVGRFTAAVFHLMRVADIGLCAFARSIHADPANKSWETVLKRMQDKLDENSAAKPPDWKSTEQYYSDLMAHFRSIKNAWRNYTMHGSERYSKDKAEEVFVNVRALMRGLAERVKE